MNAKRCLAAMKRVNAEIEGMPFDERKTVLLSVLMQQVCTMPPGMRADALADILDEAPRALSATEEGMRIALQENARRGL